jgi:hypothetical protein
MLNVPFIILFFHNRYSTSSFKQALNYLLVPIILLVVQLSFRGDNILPLVGYQESSSSIHRGAYLLEVSHFGNYTVWNFADVVNYKASPAILSI